ncbi:uncharacterized protein L3040_001992 [Drepanopeziza brunnea f. sp. 'multigermtubi']|uniref:2EXR domain-containing protein n=1 Tax=Marssonina brunnea f. sp. multigermtubi (strain MB_m1) TaxID=1072389 RepID=K1XFV7_MARBU|nr:uncharacterized protein MBM_01615 [Drepanopeziza brunnea f. sp. 'multigermtubi' MB_m1]EKD19663.1 hypothetical protein MBM_01615 [Drepanopeziza brunnea f. sp. 'multigermtubi' MB_m1]KAJ5052235.1 hypothetical protein L3040_001992 [Drepanopeziza brunnea f. sp. 'multigermtubi']
MSSLATFTLFPLLPKELQLAIWECFISQNPQTVVITQTGGFWATTNNLSIHVPLGIGGSIFRYTDGREQFVAKCSGKVQVALHTNVLARELALTHFHRVRFDAVNDHPRYFNFSRDVLAIRCHPEWGIHPKPGPEVMESLATVQNLVMLGFRHRGYALMSLSLAPFLRLKRLTLFKRRDSGPGDHMERFLTRAVQRFWTEKMNARQVGCGLQASQPPEMIFWGSRQLHEFEESFGEAQDA